jgi:hypothetical protein
LISDFTGFPEMLDGMVKTLHPEVHGGILGIRDNQDHINMMKSYNIKVQPENLPGQQESIPRGGDFYEATHVLIITARTIDVQVGSRTPPTPPTIGQFFPLPQTDFITIVKAEMRAIWDILRP